MKTKRILSILTMAIASLVLIQPATAQKKAARKATRTTASTPAAPQWKNDVPSAQLIYKNFFKSSSFEALEKQLVEKGYKSMEDDERMGDGMIEYFKPGVCLIDWSYGRMMGSLSLFVDIRIDDPEVCEWFYAEAKKLKAKDKALDVEKNGSTVSLSAIY